MDRGVIDETIERFLQRNSHYEVARMVRQSVSEHPGLPDDVALRYLQRGEWLMRLNGYQDFCRAAEYLPFGLSEQVRERMLSGFVKTGFHIRAQELAEGLGRRLSAGEVQELVENYVRGSMQSDRVESELLALATSIGGDMLRQWTQGKFSDMHERWKRESSGL